jgi:hypothetical protein
MAWISLKRSKAKNRPRASKEKKINRAKPNPCVSLVPDSLQSLSLSLSRSVQTRLQNQIQKELEEKDQFLEHGF